jgi:hypothetical protein
VFIRIEFIFACIYINCIALPSGSLTAMPRPVTSFLNILQKAKAPHWSKFGFSLGAVTRE